MRVGIDVRKLGDGGIGEYIRETVTALARLRPDLEIVAFGDPARRALLPRVEWVSARAGKYSIAEHVAVPGAARRARVDLFHAPHYVLPLGLTCPAVVTVHDVIHFLFPRTSLHRLYSSWMIASACRRAKRVIAVSETTARDLRARFGVADEKLRVVPNGVAPRFRRLPGNEVSRALAGLGVRRPYVLFVGNCLPHKNVETLVRAWAELAPPRPDLVLCGRGFEAARAVREAIAETSSAGQVRRIGPLEDDELLVALYNGAEVLASTATYEGFCLPAVEAMACGTPVLGPDAGAVPEVAGDAALLVSPHRVDMVARALYRLLADEDLRRTLVERGFRRAAGFSWEESARRTVAVYEEVRGSLPG